MEISVPIFKEIQTKYDIYQHTDNNFGKLDSPKYKSDILKKENVSLKAAKKQQNAQKHKLRQLSENQFSLSNGLEVVIND